MGAYWGFDRGDFNNSGEFRLQVDGADQPAGQTTDNYQFLGDTGSDTNEHPMMLSTVANLTAAAHTIDLDASVNQTTNTPTGQDRLLWAVSMELTAPGPPQVPFGTINANTFYQGCHDLVVSTNAGGGYSLAGLENHELMTAGGTILPDTTCNTGTCTATTGAAWTTATNNGLGHTCRNEIGNDCVSAYGNGTAFRQFADASSGEVPVSIMASTTPAIATSRVKYRVSRSTGQGAGEYSNTISYSIMATY